MDEDMETLTGNCICTDVVWFVIFSHLPNTLVAIVQQIIDLLVLQTRCLLWNLTRTKKSLQSVENAGMKNLHLENISLIW